MVCGVIKRREEKEEEEEEEEEEQEEEKEEEEEEEEEEQEEEEKDEAEQEEEERGAGGGKRRRRKRRREKTEWDLQNNGMEREREKSPLLIYSRLAPTPFKKCFEKWGIKVAISVKAKKTDLTFTFKKVILAP